MTEPASDVGMVHPGRIPMTDAEHSAVDDLIAQNGGATATLTRADPGNAGALLVQLQLPGGDAIYSVDENGQATEVTS